MCHKKTHNPPPRAFRTAVRVVAAAAGPSGSSREAREEALNPWPTTVMQMRGKIDIRTDRRRNTHARGCASCAPARSRLCSLLSLCCVAACTSHAVPSEGAVAVATGAGSASVYRASLRLLLSRRCSAMHLLLPEGSSLARRANLPRKGAESRHDISSCSAGQDGLPFPLSSVLARRRAPKGCRETADETRRAHRPSKQPEPGLSAEHGRRRTGRRPNIRLSDHGVPTCCRRATEAPRQEFPRSRLRGREWHKRVKHKPATFRLNPETETHRSPRHAGAR